MLRRSSMTCVLVLLMMGGAGWCAETPVAPAATGTPNAAAPARSPAKPQSDVPGVGNFAKISETLWRGAQPTAEGFAELKKRGVKTVVNLRSFHSDRDELAGLGLQYVHIYCQAWNPDDEDVLRFLKVVQNPENQPVFVHCQHGADRTGMMVAIYRMIEQGWPVEDAVAEVRNFGFHRIFTQISDYLKQFDAAKVKEQVKEAKAPRIHVVE